MIKVLKATLAAVTLLAAASASATPSTAFWTPATTYTQPFLVPHLTYDTYVGEQGILQPDYGLTIGVLPWEKLQGEVGIDVLLPGAVEDNFYLNAKITVPEGAYADWQPGVSFGIQSVGFKKDYSDYNHLHLTIAKTFPVIGNVAVGGYYGLNETLYTSSTGSNEQAGFHAAWTSPDINVKVTGLDKIVFIADYASGKNYFGALGLGVGFYFTPTIDVLTGPVFVNDKDLFKASFGSDFYWSVQVDVDFDLRKPSEPAK